MPSGDIKRAASRARFSRGKSLRVEIWSRCKLEPLSIFYQGQIARSSTHNARPWGEHAGQTAQVANCPEVSQAAPSPERRILGHGRSPSA